MSVSAAIADSPLRSSSLVVREARDGMSVSVSVPRSSNIELRAACVSWRCAWTKFWLVPTRRPDLQPDPWLLHTDGL